MSAREALLSRAVAWFAEHGIADTSLRTLATELGTSHRMLHYHFGSREGLLAAVVTSVELGERDLLATLLAEAEPDDPVAAGQAFWLHVADTAEVFAPLFFELAAHAMQGRPHALPMRDWLIAGWLDTLRAASAATGCDEATADAHARLCLAAARGLLFEVAITGDRAAADAAMAELTRLLSGSAPTPQPESTDRRRRERHQTGGLARRSAEGGLEARRGATTQPGRPDGVAQQP